MRTRTDIDPQALQAACDLVREAGYTVHHRDELENVERVVRESWARERRSDDQMIVLMHQYQALLYSATEHLKPSMPSWLRRHRSWWHNYDHNERVRRSEAEAAR